MKKGDFFLYKFKLSEEVYNGFILIFKDKNPLHTLEKFAIRKNFKSVVMHGNILNGFISFFIGECLPIKNVIIHSQSIKFKNPCYLYEELSFKAEIENVYDSVNTLEFNFIFANSNNLTVAKGKIQIGII